MTIGQEIVEETDTLIVIKDLLNPAEMPFDNTLKRMFVIVRNMHGDAITALETHNHALATDVINRDLDFDRLNWLIARQTNMIMQNPSLSRKMEVSTGMAMYYYIISRIIERIGDHAVRIAENAEPTMDIDLDPKIITALKKASAMSMNIFDKSIISFFNADIKEAPQDHRVGLCTRKYLRGYQQYGVQTGDTCRDFYQLTSPRVSAGPVNILPIFPRT